MRCDCYSGKNQISLSGVCEKLLDLASQTFCNLGTSWLLAGCVSPQLLCNVLVWALGLEGGRGGQLRTEQGGLCSLQPNQGHSCQCFVCLHACVFLHVGCMQYKVLAPRQPSPSIPVGCARNRGGPARVGTSRGFNHRIMQSLEGSGGRQDRAG